jgi:LPS-assembly lipoprotein
LQLRQAPELAFNSAVHGAADSSSAGQRAQAQPARSGTAGDQPDRRSATTAEVVLDVLQEQREKTVVGVNAFGPGARVPAAHPLPFRLRTPQGKELIADTENAAAARHQLQRIGVLAKEAEEGLMYRDMQTDIVQQLMRRLAAGQDAL